MDIVGQLGRVELEVGDGALLFATDLFRLAENLGHRKQTDEPRDQGNAGDHLDRAEGEAGHAGDGILTDHGHAQTQQTGGDALAEILAGDAGQAGHTHHGDGEVLRRAEQITHFTDQRCKKQQDQGGKNTADHRRGNREGEGLAGQSLFPHGIAVHTGGRVAGGAGRFEQNGGDAAGIVAAAVNAQQEAEGGIAGKRKGQGGEHGDCRGGGETWDGTEDDADGNAENNEEPNLRTGQVGNACGEILQYVHIWFLLSD